VEDALVVGGGVGVADRGVDLGVQHTDTVGEIAAQYGEAEGAEVVDLTGGEHGVPPLETTAETVWKTVPAGGARPRATGRRARLRSQGHHIQIGRMGTGYACPRRRFTCSARLRRARAG